MGVLESPASAKKGEKGANPRGATSKHQSNEGEVMANINTFGITRLVETSLVNISRIELVWKILVRFAKSNFFLDSPL